MKVTRFISLCIAVTLVLASGITHAQTRKTEVLWRGQSAFKITTPGGRVVITDPWLTLNPLGKGTPAELIQTLGPTSTRVLSLKPGEKAEF